MSHHTLPHVCFCHWLLLPSAHTRHDLAQGLVICSYGGIFPRSQLTSSLPSILCDKLLCKSDRVIHSNVCQSQNKLKKKIQTWYVKIKRILLTFLCSLRKLFHSHVKVWHLIWDLFTLYTYILDCGADNCSFQQDFHMVTVTKLAYYIKKWNQTARQKVCSFMPI